MLNQRLIGTCAFVAITLFSVTGYTRDFNLPLPEEFVAARNLNSVIQKSKDIGLAEKKKASAEFQNVNNQFMQVWNPLKSTYEKLHRTRANGDQQLKNLQNRLRKENEDLKKKVDDHNGDKSTSAAAYNARAARLNAAIRDFRVREEQSQKDLIAELEQADKAILAQMTRQTKSVESWLAGPSLRNFMKRKNRLGYKDGYAMKQLRLANQIGGIKD